MPIDDQFERLRHYPDGPLFGHVTGFFSFTFGADRHRGRLQRRPDRPRPRAADRNLGDWLIGKEPTGDVVLTARQRRPGGGPRGARRPARVGGGARPHAPARSSRCSRTRPSTHARWPATTRPGGAGGLRRADTADPANPMLPGPSGSATPRARRSRSSPPPPRSRPAWPARQPVFPRSRVPRPAPDRQAAAQLRRQPCGGTLAESFRRSCNTDFAQLGLDLGEQLVDGSQGLRLRRGRPLRPARARSGGPAPRHVQAEPAGFANAAIGQGDVAVTPLQMATGGRRPSPTAAC